MYGGQAGDCGVCTRSGSQRRRGEGNNWYSTAAPAAITRKRSWVDSVGDELAQLPARKARSASSHSFDNPDVQKLGDDDLEDYAIAVLNLLKAPAPATSKGIALANDTIRWWLEASARELRVLLKERQAMRESLSEGLEELKALGALEAKEKSRSGRENHCIYCRGAGR